MASSSRTFRFPPRSPTRLWDDVERTYLPLVGQIIVMPRWFDPRVDGVWVQAAHDGESVAVRVSWSDPNNSPDPLWADWKSLVISLMQPKEGDPQDEGPAPDQLVVQFPMQMPEGMERPFFLGGDKPPSGLPMAVAKRS